MFSNQCYEKWVSVRERIIKVLLGTVTCVAKTDTFTCIMTIVHNALEKIPPA